MAFIKGRGAEIFSKLRPPPPSYESQLAIAQTAPAAAFVLHNTVPILAKAR
jgi:hypothetical protein